MLASRMRRPLSLLLAVACLWPAAATAAAAPNVVVIETDDQTVADMAAMPQTRALIGARGVTFAQLVRLAARSAARRGPRC